MAAAPATLHPVSALRDEHVMDTRTPSPVHHVPSVPSDAPDLSAEVAMLSTKLVNAINYQTNLDDSLQQTRHELEQARQRIATLEAEKQRHDEQVTSGVLVKKADVDRTIFRLRQELATEKSARMEAEKAKKQSDNELENLTVQLFEEANKMVAAARKETEAVEKRNAQLKSQVSDTDKLLVLQQEQLASLKSTMEKLETDSAVPTRDPSVPSTPITAQHAMFEALQLAPSAQSSADFSPEHPLYYSSLIQPVLRTDTTAFADFQDLLQLARRLGAHSRTNSSQAGSQGSTGQSVYNSASAVQSSPNLPGAFSFGSSPNSSNGGASAIPPLKDSKFYKRVLLEDIEPCLRLDNAPGLSFLSRRTVIGALVQGTLAVEPYPQNKHYFACTLCGESRRNEGYLRKYRFRTSEDDNVSKPLCDYCVTRLRACCDFVGFLRMVRDGHFKSDTEEDSKSAWEETVRLRERMFWARQGGGVVPCIQQTLQKSMFDTPTSASGMKSSRESLESIPEREIMGQVHNEGREQQHSADWNQSALPSKTPEITTTESSNEAQSDADKQLQTELESQAQNGLESQEPTTPFEDAKEEADPLASASPEKEKETDASRTNSLQAPRDASPVRKSFESATSTRSKSSVLARVRAMEGNKQ